MLHLHRGTPYVYQGEELGMTNAPFASIADFADIQSRRHYVEATEVRGESAPTVLAALRLRSRDNGRTPMQWDGSAHAGFTSGTPWLPVNPNHSDINAAAQMHDPASVFSHYRALIELRHEDSLVVDGRYTLLAPDHPHLFAFTRTTDSDGMLVLANFSGTGLDVPAGVTDGWVDAPLVLGNHPDSPARLPSAVTLRGWEALVLRRA